MMLLFFRPRKLSAGTPMILMIDNYDSFTYNLVQRFGELGEEVVVYRNDKITAEEVVEHRPDHIVISPGPCTPLEAGVSNEVIKRFAGRVPVLGVCLGHQCIGHVFGATVARHRRLMHGKTSMITHDGEGVYRGLPDPFEATRYHSLVIIEDTLPECLRVTARAESDEIMGIRHQEFALEGVQFHPESFLTLEGTKLLRNFLEMR
jgi:anthranilate synthase/aminodeoxychorismate synthase-like glutamine amidotransferase